MGIIFNMFCTDREKAPAIQKIKGIHMNSAMPRLNVGRTLASAQKEKNDIIKRWGNHIF